MTWQRIDENTYIDDTLGPVRSTSYSLTRRVNRDNITNPITEPPFQFLAGQAREPIVGVRFFDAQAFCTWLTMREPNEWQYRLPIGIDFLIPDSGYTYKQQLYSCI